MEIVIEICKILDQMLPDSPKLPYSLLITHVKDRPGHDRRSAMNNSKIKRRFRLVSSNFSSWRIEENDFLIFGASGMGGEFIEW